MTASGRARLDRFRRGELFPILLILVLVLVANGVYLLGIRSNDIAENRSAMGRVQVGTVHGRTTIDNNDGYTSQALGTLAARDLIHGHIPLWNEYEGIGMPLAGEMQSAALFPPTLIQVIHNGIFWEHLFLEILGGIATYLFLRRLKIGRLAAFVGGGLFSLVGTSPWLTNAAINPIALLPVALLGVELVAHEVSGGVRRPRLGWIVFALGIGLSLLSGFPETAYIDGLLIFAYAALRWFQLKGSRRSYTGNLAGGGVAGLALAAPVITAFSAYLGFANTGTHAGACASGHISTTALPALAMPYVFGPIFGQADANAGGFMRSFWGNVGGYLTVSIIVLVIAGLLSRRRRPAALLFGGVALVMLGRIYGPHFAIQLFNLVPAMKQVCAYRYAPPALIMCAVVLVSIGLDELGERTRRWQWPAVLATGALVLAVSGITAWSTVTHTTVPHRYRWAFAAIVWAAVCLVGVAVGVFVSSRGRAGLGRRLVGAVLLVDATAMFVVPQASAGRSSIDMPAISYLQQHLGLHRVLALGALAPNYGSYFGIAQLNINDLPSPKLFGQFATTDLYPNSSADVFFPGRPIPGRPAPGPVGDALVAHFEAYRAAGVAYVMTTPGHLRKDQAAQIHLKLAYEDSYVRIWQVPNAVDYFTPADPSCVTTAQSRFDLDVTCSQPTTMVRNEMYAPGWTATVNGRSTSITPGRLSGMTVDAFQQISVPAGRSHITFRYRPAHFTLALLAAGASSLSMLSAVGWWLVRRRRASRKSVTSL